jgi:hypothetical protein
MKYQFIFLICLSFAMLETAGQSKKKVHFSTDQHLLKVINNNFKDAALQYKLLAKNLPQDKFPKTYFPTKGKYEFSASDWWCSGFYRAFIIFMSKQGTLLCTTKQSAF